MNRDIVTIEEDSPKVASSVEKEFAQAQAALTGIPGRFQEKPKARINLRKAVASERHRSKYNRTVNANRLLDPKKSQAARSVFFLKQVTVVELAHGIGTDPAHVVKLMKGTRAPSVTLLYRMSVYLTAATGEQVTMEDVMRLLELRPWEMK